MKKAFEPRIKPILIGRQGLATDSDFSPRAEQSDRTTGVYARSRECGLFCPDSAAGLMMCSCRAARSNAPGWPPAARENFDTARLERRHHLLRPGRPKKRGLRAEGARVMPRVGEREDFVAGSQQPHSNMAT
ncbi:MAG: hypothetical protein N3I86_01850 [Verrucomicrobiae bacterium]|nr:hypothetical protein [Verrucomicrobiae bacterium]